MQLKYLETFVVLHDGEQDIFKKKMDQRLIAH